MYIPRPCKLSINFRWIYVPKLAVMWRALCPETQTSVSENGINIVHVVGKWLSAPIRLSGFVSSLSRNYAIIRSLRNERFQPNNKLLETSS
jgi:hypothetical protein